MVLTTSNSNPTPSVFMETIQCANTNVLRTEVKLLGEKPTSGLKGPLLKQLTLVRGKLVKSLVYCNDEQARQVYDRRAFTFQKLSGTPNSSRSSKPSKQRGWTRA